MHTYPRGTLQEQYFYSCTFKENDYLTVSFPDQTLTLPGIIYRRPQGLRDDLLAVFLLPFSKKVWFCILASLPVVALAIHLATRPLAQLRQCLPARYRPTSRGRAAGLGLSVSPRPRLCRPSIKNKDKVKQKRKH